MNIIKFYVSKQSTGEGVYFHQEMNLERSGGLIYLDETRAGFEISHQIIDGCHLNSRDASRLPDGSHGSLGRQ